MRGETNNMRLFSRFRTKSAEDKIDLNHLIKTFNLQGLSGDKLSEATYFACLKVLSECMGKLPISILRYDDKRGTSKAYDHAYYRMINTRPNRFMTASTFWSTLELHRNHYGNGYVLIDQPVDVTKDPQLWLLDPTKVKVYYDNAKMIKDVPDVYYVVSTPTGQEIYGSEEIIHVKSHYTLDGLVGLSVAEQLASTVGGSVKAQKMLEGLYDSGLTAKAVLHYTGDLSDKSAEAFAKLVEDYATGKLKSRGVTSFIPVPVGASITPLNLKLTDSQFLELKQYTALQIASAFGVKPYQIGDYTKSSYASAEAQQLSFLVDTLLYIIKQYEEEIGYKLLSNTDAKAGCFIKCNINVLLRADHQTQVNTLSQAVNSFLYTPNEAREKLDMPWKEGGDQLLGNGASIPVAMCGTQYNHNTNREEDKQWLRQTITEILQTMQTPA